MILRIEEEMISESKTMAITFLSCLRIRVVFCLFDTADLMISIIHQSI